MSHADVVAWARDGVLLVALGLALYTDLTRGKVYDWLALPAIGLGLLISCVAGAVDATQGNAFRPLIASLAGLALAIGIFGVAYLLHMLGGGDVKLLAAVGALMGWRFFLDAAVLTVCAGAIVAVGVLVWRGRLREGLKGSVMALVAPRRFKEAREKTPPGSAELMTLPYTVAIVAGTLVAWILTQA